jgi:hypothetical protein
VRQALAALLLIGCGSFDAAPGSAQDAAAPDGSAGDGGAVADGSTSEGGAKTSKLCPAAGTFIYCEDFSARSTLSDVTGAFPNGTAQGAGNPTFEFVEGDVGVAARALTTTIDTGPVGDGQIEFWLDRTPPALLRLRTRVRIDQMSDVDILALGFLRTGVGDEYVYVTLLDSKILLAEYDSNVSEFAQPGPTLEVGRFYDIELRVEQPAAKASLYVDGALAVSRTLVRVTEAMTQFRFHYGLYSGIQPRAPRVTFDDVELLEN